MTHIGSTLDAQSATHAYLERATNDFAGDPRTNLAVMMIEHANEARAGARAQQQLEEQHLRQMQAEQVEAMHREADLVRAAGQARGMGSLVGGILTAGSGFIQMGGAASNTPSASSSAAPRSEDSGDIDWAAVLRGGGGVAQGTGELIGANYDGRAGHARADGTQFDHRAQASERRRQALDERTQEARELRRTAMDHLQSVSSSDANAAQAVIFRG